MTGNCTWHAAWQEEMRGRVQAQVKLNPDMTVVLQAPMVETGVGSNACVTFACADALSFLGTRPEDIHWIHVVDTETGLVDITKVVTVNDVGKVINWDGCEGQAYGGAIMAIAIGLFAVFPLTPEYLRSWK